MHNKCEVDRNNVQDDILANEDDNFMEDVNEDPEVTGLYFILCSIKVSSLILNQMVCSVSSSLHQQHS